MLPSSHCSVSSRTPSPQTIEVALRVARLAADDRAGRLAVLARWPRRRRRRRSVERLADLSPTQTLPVPQAVPSPSAVPALHFLPMPRPTVTGVARLDAVAGVAVVARRRVGARELARTASQPLFGPLPPPKSQSSPVSTTPLPQTADAEAHAPSLHTSIEPHDVAVLRRVGHCLADVRRRALELLAQPAARRSRSPGSRRRTCTSTVQPSFLVPLSPPSSQSSPGSFTPLPHTGTVHWPNLQ